MLDAFISENLDAIISRARARVSSRRSPKPTDVELNNGIPIFLDQLCAALREAQSSNVIDHEKIGASAGRHGRDLHRMGLTIAQVVHDYGDVCQVITELSVEQNVALSAEEFRTLNLCLDDAIAGAVTEYSRQREQRIEYQGIERLGGLAHEQRNLLNTASLAFESIRRGHVAPGGSTGTVLARSLVGIGDIIDRSLTEVRLDAGLEHHEKLSVAELIEQVEVGALIHAQQRDIDFTVTHVEHTLTVEGDRPTLAGALANLLQNAFKFTPEKGKVSMHTHATADRVLFEIEDECGGLPPGRAEDLFRPFEQAGDDRSGIGLGLSICMKAAKANGGELRVRDIPGKGCVFTLDLPRKPPPPLAVVDADGTMREAGSPANADRAESQATKPPKPRALFAASGGTGLHVARARR